MDNHITNWETNQQPQPAAQIQEGIAIGPFEPYKLDSEGINWN